MALSKPRVVTDPKVGDRVTVRTQHWADAATVIRVYRGRQMLRVRLDGTGWERVVPFSRCTVRGQS